MMIDRSLAESAQMVDDVLNGGVFVAFFHKKAEGCVQYEIDGLFRMFVSRHGTSLLYIRLVCFKIIIPLVCLSRGKW